MIMTGLWSGRRTATVLGRSGWVLAAVVVAGLCGTFLAVPGVAVHGEADEAGLPPDLNLVSRDAVAVVSIRLADLWNNDLAKGIREKMDKELKDVLGEWNKAMGLAPADIERLTLVFSEIRPGVEPMPVIIVGAAQPYDKAKVLANVAPDAKEEKRKDRTLYVGPKDNAIHFVNDRVFVVSSAEGVRTFLERPEPKKDGPLQSILARAAEKHAVVAGLVAEPVVKQLPGNLPAEAEPFKALLKTRTATLVVDIGGEVKADLHLSFGADQEAKAGKDALQAALQLGLMGLGHGIEVVAKEAEGTRGIVELLKSVETAAKQTKIEQKGSAVEIAAAVKLDMAAAGVAAAEAVQKVRQAAARIHSVNNLKQLALAMHNYHDATGQFPPQAVYDKNGKPLLSWRVLILPYIEGDQLFKEFKLDEPWDSEHNKKLLAKMPRVFAMQSQPANATETFYQAFTGKGALFDGKQGIKITDITDGTSNTIMFVEAAKAVPWTKPEDLTYDPDKPLPKLGNFFGKGFNAALCDGSVRFISAAIAEANLRALITRNGGEVLPMDFDK
jgi:hypothetical protein